ncbi:hypothetical protein EYF80_044146 [Liparis tanakae]|uniref:Uncharacterized protein n=1 Tax=Liparis tanakae TaxID=230148 RepID=A0A4Z2FWK8_9TELE|nr:hypothetical protein EYF80_044146 [Liparis tanakae]
MRNHLNVTQYNHKETENNPEETENNHEATHTDHKETKDTQTHREDTHRGQSHDIVCLFVSRSYVGGAGSTGAGRGTLHASDCSSLSLTQSQPFLAATACQAEARMKGADATQENVLLKYT